MPTSLVDRPGLPDLAPTPGALLGRLGQARCVADAAEVEILELAVEWAHAHPDLDEDGLERAWKVRGPVPWTPGEYDASVAGCDDYEVVEWCGIPGHHLGCPGCVRCGERDVDGWWEVVDP